MAKNNLGLHKPIFLNEARVSGARESERDKRKLYLHLEALHTAHIGGWTQWKRLKWDVRFLQTDHLSSHVKRKIYSTWSGESLTVRSWQMIHLYSWGRRGREPILWCTKDPPTLVALSAQNSSTIYHIDLERMFNPRGFNSIWEKDHCVSIKLFEKQFDVTEFFA